MKLFGDTVDRSILEPYVAEGLLSCKKHPAKDLVLYNYTPKCQYAQTWDDNTMQCRGLIVKASTGEIVARPFPKFFNYGDPRSTVPAEPFEVFEKLDGSLGIVYYPDGRDGQMFVASRGSFESDQAKWATQFLHQHTNWNAMNYYTSYMFEIIYPENKIVVDYGDRAELVLLAMIDTATGEEYPYTKVQEIAGRMGVSFAKRFGMFTEIDKLPVITDNSEGYVLRFQSGTRLKIKSDEYMRLHRLITGVNARTIWECLQTGADLSKVYEHVPDEFYAWVKETERTLLEQYAEIEARAKWQFGWVVDMYGSIQDDDFGGLDTVNRKDAAQYFSKDEDASILWNMLDRKPYNHIIWSKIRPAASKPPREDVDA